MLTDIKAKNMQPGGKAAAVGGLSGLFLRPSKLKGRGKFFLRFVSPETGKRRDMGLGAYPTLGLAKARKLAMKQRILLEQGIDPLEERCRTEEEHKLQKGIPTFEMASEAAFNNIAPSFKNAKHKAQWIGTLRQYILPKIGQIQVHELEPSDFGRALQPI